MFTPLLLSLRRAGRILLLGALTAAVVTFAEPVAQGQPSDESKIKILLASDREGNEEFSALGLRPNLEQSFFLFLKNSSKKKQVVRLEIIGGRPNDDKISSLDVTVPKDLKVPVVLMAGAKPFEMHNFLHIRALSKGGEPIDELLVPLFRPRDYVKAKDPEYYPRASLLKVPVVRLQRFTGPKCELGLVLDRVPALDKSADWGKNVRDFIDAGNAEALLQVSRLKFNTSEDRDGFVYLTADGYERAFTFFASFGKEGRPIQLRRVDVPILRLIAARQTKPVKNYLVRLEADNVPVGWSIELEDQNKTYAFAGERQKKLLVTPKAAGEIAVKSQVLDWSKELDFSGVQGKRDLTVRLLDSSGRKQKFLNSAERSIKAGALTDEITETIMVTDSPPAVVLTDLPKEYKPGAPLRVKARAVDKKSGIVEVQFFLGKPPPKEGAPKDPVVVKTPDEDGLFSAKLQVPAEQKETLDVSVRAKNGVGVMSEPATDTVAMAAAPPAPAARKASITGEVYEGDRLQRSATVDLYSRKESKYIKRATTDAKGNYSFKDLEPGVYFVYAQVPARKTKGQSDDVTLEAGDMKMGVKIKVR